MRVMVLVKATDDSEKGFLPTTETMAAMQAMGRFNDELRQGRHPARWPTALSRPRRASVLRSMARPHGHRRAFAETRELVAGFWLWEVKDMDEAVAWVKRCPNPMPGPSEIEIRPLYEMADLQRESEARGRVQP